MTTRKRRPADAPMRCLSYGRVSTGKQVDAGLSLGDQEDTLAAEVTRRGWEHVAHVTDPGLSGKRMTNRKGLLAALERLDRGDADVLLASKVDRVARSTADFAGLLDRAERKGWKICVLDIDVDTTGSAGRMVAEIVAAAAAFESRRIGERVKSAHAVRKSLGQRAGQAPMLSDNLRQRIARDHASGMSMNGIATALNSDNVPTARGGAWHASTVAHVLRSVELDAELERIRRG
ncbi:MAG: recombinase family protein [Acidimicrobiales bacterium]